MYYCLLPNFSKITSSLYQIFTDHQLVRANISIILSLYVQGLQGFLFPNIVKLKLLGDQLFFNLKILFLCTAYRLGCILIS